MKSKIFLFCLAITSLLLLINFSSSQTPYNNCCELTSSGDQCVSLDDESQCRGNYADSDCKLTTFCQTGCCYNSGLGNFEPNVLQQECLTPNNWDSNDPSCKSIPGSEYGCCILPNEKFSTTSKRCEQIITDFGLSNNQDVRWDGNIDEIECQFIPEPTGKGACVIGEDFCKHNYFSECESLQGEFFEGFLCTSQEEGIEKVCEPTENTLCQGEDVYFKDSCDNIANIYDSSKLNDQRYWEKFIDEKDSCGANSRDGNAGSASCGNCNRFDGSFCSLPDLGERSPTTYGDYFCKSNSCTLEDGTIYQSGESWCVYDGKIGEGDDTVGSLHFKYECQNGEIIPSQCADYRNEICKQVDITDPATDEIISGANCELNEWERCIDINKENSEDAEKVEELCSQNSQCFLRSIEIDDVRFSICVPQYPPGFNFNLKEGTSNFEEQLDICSIGTQTCNRIEYRKGLFDYDCEVNCACGKPELTEEMNNICRSLGDCGASVNYIGELTSEGFNGYYKDKKRDLNLRGGYLDSLRDYYNNFLGPIGIEEINLVDESRLESLYQEGYGSSFVFLRGEIGTTLKYVSPIKYSYYGFGSINPFDNGVSIITDSINLIMFGDYKNKKSKFKAFKGRNVDKIIYTCEPWQQPLGGENCELCNDGDVPCSEYRCSSLGAACRIVNAGTGEEKCTWEDEDDNIAPQVDLSDENPNYEINENSDGSLTISPTDASCFDAYEDINITITTNEFAKCRYSYERRDFEDMDLISGLWSYEHILSLYLQDPSYGTSSGIEISKETNLYIKCTDRNGNGATTNTFLELNLCVYEGPDMTKIRINSFEPESGFKTAYNKEDQLITLYTNKPAECRWSQQDQNYSKMSEENTLLCANDPDEKRPKGFECETLLPLTSDSNTFYFRCLDQPWLAEPDENGIDRSSERKESETSEVYELNRIESRIQIDSITPFEDLDSKTLSKVIDVEVETSNGGDIHTCYYSKTSFDKNLVEMLQSKKVGKHTQPQVSFFVGENNLFVECRDETGDKVREEVNFQLNYGTSSVASLISRVWQDKGTLNIITTESVECRVSTEQCNFDWEEAESIGTSVFHDLSIRQGRTYFIKCLDSANNIPNSCSLKVVPA